MLRVSWSRRQLARITYKFDWKAGARFPDKAHRSQYGFGGKVNEKTGEMGYGFASNLRDALPDASFTGFTGTPIEQTDASTRAVTTSGFDSGGLRF